MAMIKERLVELINLASVEVDGNKKVEYLCQVKELALNHGLVHNFFQDILAFQNERAPNVKKFVLTFIEAACKHDSQLCPKAILNLNLLLNDTNTEVIKRSVQAATQFCRALVQWIANTNDAKMIVTATASSCGASSVVGSNDDGGGGGVEAGEGNPVANSENSPLSPQQQQQQQQILQQSQIHQLPLTTNHQQLNDMTGRDSSSPTTNSDSKSFDDEIEKTWLMWLQMTNFICNLLETTNNDGVRTHCIKFIETIVLMQTPRDKYTDQGYELNLIDPMIASIKLSSEAVMSGVIDLPKSGVLFNEEHKLELVDAAKRRFEQLVLFHGTSHISSVNLMAAMQSLVVLAKQRYRLFMGQVIQAMEFLHNRLPPTLTESQVQSVKKFLKLQLTVMLKHPYSLDRFQHQITQLLQAVGSKQPEIHRVISDFKHKFGCESQVINNNVGQDAQKRIKLEPGLKSHQTNVGSQSSYIGSQGIPLGKAKNLDLNKLTQELDEKEKRQIVVDSVRRILNDEKQSHISPAQMDIKKKVLSTLANEFHNTECPKIIQDYIFEDIRNRHEICYAIIRKNYDVAATKAAKRQINLFDNQELLRNYFECFNSYLNRAMELKESKDKDIILPKLYSLKEEYYTLANQDQEQGDK